MLLPLTEVTEMEDQLIFLSIKDHILPEEEARMDVAPDQQSWVGKTPVWDKNASLLQRWRFWRNEGVETMVPLIK